MVAIGMSFENAIAHKAQAVVCKKPLGFEGTVAGAVDFVLFQQVAHNGFPEPLRAKPADQF